jgi:glycosyltransferase involved in cell wall biosynthesis
MSRPLVSVVTPVYNGAEFLRECIDSVLAQTYENWEYLIVDNCSTDGTLEIARSYEAREPRIRVLTPDGFVDQIESANRSLREISPESKYTKVVHADDWLFPECLERMVDLAERNPTVGVVSAYRLEESQVDLTGLPYTTSVLPGREICRSTLLGPLYLFGSPTSILVRSDLVRARDPFYDRTFCVTEDYALSEDQDACCAILRQSDFGFVHQVLTFTRRPAGSPFSGFVHLGAFLPELTNLVTRHGTVYLTEPEYQRRLAALLARYGFFLFTRLPRFAEPNFRVYHRAAARRLARDVDMSDVFAGVLENLHRIRKNRNLHPGP